MSTKPSTPMGRLTNKTRVGISILLALAVVATGWLFFRPGPDSYSRPPVITKVTQVTDPSVRLEPVRLQVVRDTLFVSYNGLARIDAYNFDLELLRTIQLKSSEPVLPTSFTITDSTILVGDHHKGVVAVFDLQGNYLESFGTLPDGLTRLAPIALTIHSGVVYAADMGLSKVLAISLNDIPDITEKGELILAIPADEKVSLKFPSAVQVTPDGRLLIGDAGAARVKVFTCDGREVYDFDQVPGIKKFAPQGFAYDRVIDPSLQDSKSFDPSGVRTQGRIHVVDGYNGKVHIFNPLGTYIASYPEKGRFQGPAGIAADRVTGNIFIADPPAGRIYVYSTQGD